LNAKVTPHTISWTTAGVGSLFAVVALWPRWEQVLGVSVVMIYSAYLVSGAVRRKEVVLGPVPVDTADSAEWRWAVIVLGLAGLLGAILRLLYVLVWA
jgi:hypothetical protein